MRTDGKLRFQGRLERRPPDTAQGATEIDDKCLASFHQGGQYAGLHVLNRALLKASLKRTEARNYPDQSVLGRTLALSGWGKQPKGIRRQIHHHSLKASCGSLCRRDSIYLLAESSKFISVLFLVLVAGHKEMFSDGYY